MLCKRACVCVCVCVCVRARARVCVRIRKHNCRHDCTTHVLQCQTSSVAVTVLTHSVRSTVLRSWTTNDAGDCVLPFMLFRNCSNNQISRYVECNVLDKLFFQLTKNFPAFYVTRRFIPLLTIARYLPLSRFT